MPPYIEVDLEQRLLKITVGPMQSQNFPLDQVTQILAGQKSFNQASITVYVNGIANKEMISDIFDWSKLPTIEAEILSFKK